MKVALSEIKKTPQGPNNAGDEAEIHINNLEHKEEKRHSVRTARRKKNPKNENRIRSLWDKSKHTNIQIIGMPKEEGEQETENLFEKIMKENFPNLVKEIDI